MSKVNKIVWKPIPEFEGFYEVNNIGDVRSVERYVVNSIGYRKNLKGKLLKKGTDKDGYKDVCMCKEGKEYHKRCHRLVAAAFIPNPDNKPLVNHINGIPDDNRVSNLEWCTEKENTEHAIRTGLMVLNSKRVYQKDMNGVLIKEWPSLSSIGKAGYDYKQVHRVLYNGRRTHKGCKWEYVTPLTDEGG
jgi:hypothetical protein